MDKILEFETQLAIRAAVESGRMASERPLHSAAVAKETSRDIVTPIDIAIEVHVRKLLADSGHPVIGEETNSDCRQIFESTPVWLVDPIDGTANYANGLDYFAVSVALCQCGDFLLGAVCVPRANELFCTFGRTRALLNGKTINHEHRSPNSSLVAASFSGAMGDILQRRKEYDLFGTINDRTRGCLRLGSAATNICFTAAGRLQAAYGIRAKIWDVAAGLAIAIGAGCKVAIAIAEDKTHIDYIVGSRETVDMIHELLFQNGLMTEKCRIL